MVRLGYGPRRRNPSKALRRRVGLRIAVLLAATLFASSSALPAEAYNARFNEPGSIPCGNLNASKFVFGAHSQWTSALKNEFEGGFDAWVYDIEKYSGGYLLSESGQEWTARWKNLGSDNARTTCLPWAHDIEFNTLYFNDYDQGVRDLEAIAAHEWGHAFGLGHAGEEDLDIYSTQPPTMATCVDSGSNARATLTSDDEAGILAANESVGGWETATANASFEENEASHKEYWRTQNINSFYASTSGGGVDGSTWYGVFRATPGVTNGAIFSDTYITADNGESYKGRANYRKHNSSDFGTIQVTMKTRQWRHADSTRCSLVDINDKMYVSGWVTRNKTCVPSNNWSYCTTSSFVMPGAGDRLHQARIAVYNRMQNNLDGGTNTYVRTDRDRVMIYGYSG